MKSPAKARGVQLYYKTFNDQMVIDSIVRIIEDIIHQRHPDDSSMGLYNVGDVRTTKGFWASELMIMELTQGFIGRAIRVLTERLDVHLYRPGRRDYEWIAYLLEDTNRQAVRIVPTIKEKALAKFGTPPEIDEAKITDLTSRAFRTLHGYDS